MGVLALLGLAAGTVAAQSKETESTAKPQQQSETKRNWSEVWRNATVAFGEVKPDPLANHPYFRVLGGGVIINTGKQTAYLVTVKHMFCDPDKGLHPAQLRVRFAWQEHKSIYDYLGMTVDLRSQSGADLWSSLEDGSDIAAIDWPLSFLDALPPDDRPTAVDSIDITDVVGDVYEGESVFVLGYPEIVEKEKLARAILRQGIVAWTNPNQPEERTFLVDANLVPGNSGGPVIKFPTGLKKDGSFDYLSGGHLNLLGIVSQVPSEYVRTRVGQIETRTDIVGIGGIGEIEPASKIAKLIGLIRQGTIKPPVCDIPEQHPQTPAPATPR